MQFYLIKPDNTLHLCKDTGEWLRNSPFVNSVLSSDGVMSHGEQHRRITLSSVGEAVISTVFLGIDSGGGPFETMIFSADNGINNYQERYKTYEEAVEGHKRNIEKVKLKKGIYE